ncbi:MAG TPA: hypothetical protein VFR64_15940 [Methylomirabilota bacterium]|nr:hypothetical protein [Methylomirabilota bacterium]
MMADSDLHPELDALVRGIASQVRWRRAEHFALRGVFWGAVTGVVVLLFKVVIGPWAPVVAGAVVLAGLLAGGLWGLSRGVSSLDAARLGDRAFGLHDRATTALEWAGRADRTPLVEALIADARAHAARLTPRQIVPRVLPREVKWLPALALVVLILFLSPAVPLPSASLFDLTSTTEDEDAVDRSGGDLLQQDQPAATRDRLRRSPLEERDYMARTAGGGAPTAGDLSALFKDTSLGNQRPDFNSFLKKGDERLKLLEQVDRLPDLQSDFTTSQYKMVFRKSKALRDGLRPDQISPQKLRELLQEMERLGRKGGGDWSSDVGEGMEALEYGDQDRALEAMEKALDKLRAMEEGQRSGRGLRGGKETDRDRDRRSGGSGAGGEDPDFGEGEGMLPGKGKNPTPKGEASQRLRANPYDVGVEGESRQGRKDGYDTNLTGRGGHTPSRLTYLGVIGQYRKAMEDSLVREQVPRDYHEQIRDYFQSLDER